MCCVNHLFSELCSFVFKKRQLCIKLFSCKRLLNREKFCVIVIYSANANHMQFELAILSIQLQSLCPTTVWEGPPPSCGFICLQIGYCPLRKRPQNLSYISDFSLFALQSLKQILDNESFQYLIFNSKSNIGKWSHSIFKFGFQTE